MTGEAAITLRLPREDEEAEFLRAHHATSPEVATFLHYYRDGMPLRRYLMVLDEQAHGIGLPSADHVATTFLFAFAGHRIVGRVSIRHALNDLLTRIGGHIGYVVVPEFRRRGYGTEMLRLALPIAHEKSGSDRILVTCDDDNLGSIRTIEKNGGVLENVVTGPGLTQPKRRYWIAVASSMGDAIPDLYERHAHAFDRDRGRDLWERAWLDRFLAFVPADGTVLDLGCGMAEPLAAYLIAAGRGVVGVDASPSMIALCRGRFPDHEWLVHDMRTLTLDRQFAGVLAWDSFFHLSGEAQRAMFARFAAQAAPGAPLMFTSGTSEGEVYGEYGGEPLFHASLDASEYQRLLTTHGFTVRAHVADDAECKGHTVWLATRAGTPAAGAYSRA